MLSDSVPYAYEGRPYERIGSTTRKMSREEHEKLLLERTHAKRRWENMACENVRIQDLDKEEILRTRELAIQQSRISAGTSRNIGEILDRLGLREGGVITQAAQVLYGTKFLPNYPQCILKMGRFRGTEITGEIVDNRQEYLNAFVAVREGMAFLERTLPLGAKFPAGKIFREDRFPVPPDALREILLNAVMHRDYSYSGGHAAIAIFDDRVEIRSYGLLPTGVTVDQLAGHHLSKLRNPLIAGAFHLTGAVETWGRGTNRVIEVCKKYGIEPPTFEERQGFVIVTFKAEFAEIPSVGDQVGTKSGPSRDQVELLKKCLTEQALTEIMSTVGRSNRTKFRDQVLNPLLEQGWLEMTLPDKPNSRLQKYRLTKVGLGMLSAVRNKRGTP